MTQGNALNRWLASREGGRTQLARAAGVRWQTVDDISRGKHVPRASTAIAISRATGGEVTAAELLGIEAHPVTDGAAKPKRKAARASSGRASSGAR